MEEGFLLLCADLGDGKKPLTLPQFRTLADRMLAYPPDSTVHDCDVTVDNLMSHGYDAAFAARIVDLLGRKEALMGYLSVAADLNIDFITRVSPCYPSRLRRLGKRAPAVLFFRGNEALLSRHTVALVGSRELSAEGEAFARRVGTLAAVEGYTLVSGNACGADQVAQTACLEAGGTVIAVLPDGLQDHPPTSSQMLFLCEGGWHLPMSACRALERNRLIHALAEKSFVAQSKLTGGTWRGTEENLRYGWSSVYVHDDGSPGCTALISMGAGAVRTETLDSLQTLSPMQLLLVFD